jgi:DNA-binding NarL/FixJ family response regulator
VSGTAHSICSLRVLLVGLSGSDGDVLAHVMSRARIAVERAATMTALLSRIAQVELDPPLVVYIDLGLLEAEDDELFFALRRALPGASWVALSPALDGEQAAHALGLGIPALPLPRNLDVLVELAQRLSALGTSRASTLPPHVSAAASSVGDLASALEAYALARGLSEKQRTILSLYLRGRDDKAIAAVCRCSVATVYEHWRRMAKKAGAAQKGDVVADFHRFLADGRALS